MCVCVCVCVGTSMNIYVCINSTDVLLIIMEKLCLFFLL